MAEASAAGVHPHLFWDYTYRELHAVIAGQGLLARRNHKLVMWGAWQAVNLKNHKRLPDLGALLRKLDPTRIMSAGAIRQAVLGIASAMGAEVVRRTRKE